MPRLTLALPATHALTRIQGEQIRDWQVKPEGERQVLTVEFIKPVEKAYAVTLFSEQTVETTPLTATLVPPQPLEVERESGSFTLSADDTTWRSTPRRACGRSTPRPARSPPTASTAARFHRGPHPAHRRRCSSWPTASRRGSKRPACWSRMR